MWPSGSKGCTFWGWCGLWQQNSEAVVQKYKIWEMVCGSLIPNYAAPPLLHSLCLWLLWQHTPLTTSSCGNSWWSWVRETSESSVEQKGFPSNDNSTKSVRVLRYCWNITVTITASVAQPWDTAKIIQRRCCIMTTYASLAWSLDTVITIQ